MYLCCGLQSTQKAWLQISKFVSNKVPAGQFIKNPFKPWQMKNFEQSSGCSTKTASPFIEWVHIALGLLRQSLRYIAGNSNTKNDLEKLGV